MKADTEAERPDRRADMDLLWRLLQLGETDREQYRRIRAVMWALFVANSDERSRHSDRPSNSS